MSLLNQMLNDLDQRRAEAAGAPVLHRDIRPLPAAPSSMISGWVWMGMVLLALIGGGLGWWFYYGPERPLPPVPVPTPAQQGAAALPELVATAPVIPITPLPEPLVAEGMAAAGPLAAGPAAPPAQSASAPPVPVKSSAKLRLSGELTLPPGMVQEATVASPVGSDGAIEKKDLVLNAKDQAERLYRAAVTYLAQGREQDGWNTLRAALKDDPEHLAARQLLVKISVDRRNYDQARDDLEEGLRHLPKQTAWALLLSRLYVDRNDPAKALAVLERHEGHAGNAADYQGAMAAMLQRLNRHAEAEGRFVRATQSEPANGRWWLGLGMARETQGKTAEAREAYRMASSATGLSAELRAFAEAKLK